jgi:uncharacterized protein
MNPKTATAWQEAVTSPSEADASMLPVRERIQALDTLRGVAVGGILLANVLVFFGLIFMPPDGRRLITVFAPVGRMALTNYLMHSIICVTLSYGFGFGLWWRTGASRAMAIAVAIVAVQIPLSAWWLSRFRFGPIEWIWRRLTYRQPLEIRAG